jgi:hypothetical protein
VDDMIIKVLKDYFEGQGIYIGTMYASALKPPFIIARRERRSGTPSIDSTDDRFIQSAIVSINTVTDGPDADQIAEELQEACRLAIREAQQNQTEFPAMGSISSITNSIEPSRVADWATSTGQVQYASLPKGWTRFESVYRLLIRAPKTTAAPNRFVNNRNITPSP